MSFSKKYYFSSAGKMVCPLHDDKKPSMGIVVKSDGTELFHCFGCNSWGDVVDFHIRVSGRLFGKKGMSRETALKELSKEFGVRYEDALRADGSASVEESNICTDMKLRMLADDVGSLQDFKYSWMQARKQGMPIGYLNDLLMRRIASVKKLEDGEKE
mgnify:FL=1